jgi:hypothetical protein
MFERKRVLLEAKTIERKIFFPLELLLERKNGERQF